MWLNLLVGDCQNDNIKKLEKKKKKSRVEGRFKNCFPTIEGYPQGVR
jgi:hypothetical protein